MPSNLWDDILARIEDKVSGHVFHRWFRPTRLLDCEGDTVTVVVPDDLFKDWLTRHYAGLMQDAADEIGRPKIVISLVTADAAPVAPTPAASGAGAPEPAFRTNGQRFQQRYTFGEFVVGSSNQFAHAAARAVAEAPARSYNPLFIYGDAGLGKTHLMHAIGEYIDIHSSQSTTYISADRFMNEMISALRFGQIIDFRTRYRGTDVLLMDDIQFLKTAERTQIEFFHTFNALHDAQKQIVVSCDCPPRDLQFLDDRLKSRFEWGLIADIQPPDLETRVAIIMKKAEHLVPAIPIDDAVALYIAQRIKSNIREIEGSLTTLIARASLWRKPISLSLAQDVLPNIGEQDKPAVTIEIIQRHIALHHGLKPRDLKSKTKSRTIVMPRQIAMYLARDFTGSSYPEIGRKFGKHYSTVMHACDKIDEKCGKDAEFSALLDSFRKAIRDSLN